jgi:hypothetical protein
MLSAQLGRPITDRDVMHVAQLNQSMGQSVMEAVETLSAHITSR